MTIGGQTTKYEPHEARFCEQLVADGHPREAALVHQLKATFDARILRELGDMPAAEAEPEQLRIA